MKNTNSLNPDRQRAFELDLLRGLAIIAMILHHFIYDLRYIMEMDVFAWQDSFVFENWVRPPFLFVFLFVSGVCCTFSRNNFLRSLKLFAVSILFSLVFYFVSIYTETEMYVVFNVLHMLTLGTFVFALMSLLENRKIIKGIDKILIFLGVIFLWMAYPLSKIPEVRIDVLIPFHENFARGLGMGDYLPIVPWIGFFFTGAFFGRIYYKNKESLFPHAPVAVKKLAAPFEFVGRNALIFYVLHQPVLLASLYLLRFTGII
jgi:uncharacterized membrane protein